MKHDQALQTEFGARLAKARAAKELSLQGAASKLEAAGIKVSRATVGAWEDGRNLPDSIVIGRLAKIYGVTADALMAALGRSWRGRKYSGTELPVFLEAKNLFPLVINDLDPVLKQVDFVTDKGGKAEGFEAALLPMVCEIYLQARQAGILTAPQLPVAQRCEMLVRSLAKVGITALIDEATGYQEVRDRDALQALLDKYLLQEHAAWAKRFPDEFYRQMFRLKGWEFPTPSGARPGVVGKYTLDIVYERIAPGLVDELKQRNPKSEAGHRKVKHHQWLTEDVGHPALGNHIHAVMGLMRASKSWEMFKNLLDSAFPKKGTQFPLAIDD